MADINVTLVISDGITVGVSVGTSANDMVKYNSADLAAGYLSDKVVAGL